MKRFITLLSAAALALSCIVSPQTAEAATGDPAAINYVDTMYKNMNGASSMGMKFDTSLVYGIAAGSPVSDAVRMSGEMLTIGSQGSSITANIDMGMMSSAFMGNSGLASALGDDQDSMLGILLSQRNTRVEFYSIKNTDGSYDMYTYNGKKWSKEHTDGSAETGSGNTANTISSSSALNDPMKLLSNLAIAATSQAIGGKDCVSVTGEITGDTLSSILMEQNQVVYKSERQEIKSLKQQKKKMLKQQKNLEKKLKKTKNKKKQKNIRKNIKNKRSQLKECKDEIKIREANLKQQMKNDQETREMLTKCSPAKTTFQIEKATNNPVRIDMDMTAFIQTYLLQDPSAKAYASMVQSCGMSVTYHSINAVEKITVPAAAYNS